MSLSDVPPELSEMQLLEQLSFERHLLNESAKLQAQLKTEAFAAKHLAAMDDEAEAKKNRQKADSAEHALRARRADEYAAALEEANHKAIEERRRMCINRAEDEAQQLKSASGTDAKVLAGAISSFAREGRRMVVTGIGAAAINQVVKAIAIARKNIEEEAIDLTCKPEFTEVNEGVTALRMLLLVEQT